jgi:hypothetical protein
MNYCPGCGMNLNSDLILSETRNSGGKRLQKPKKKLSAWNKYVKANSSKPRFRYARSNKINLKKMAVAFRKTPAGKKKR